MVKFDDFNFAWTYLYAAYVRKLVFREEPERALIDIDDFFCVDKYFIEKALNPSPVTFLHDFIEQSVDADIEYSSRKLGYEQIDEWHEMLDAYGVKYENDEDYEKSEDYDEGTSYEDYIVGLVSSDVAPKIVNETFTLLFADRELLLEFNKVLADFVKTLNLADHPTLLANDGKVKRCNYWPRWVTNALVYRDKGRCSICLCDLSGLVVVGDNYAVDHIVPLNLGGTNDVTNLQLLCQPCNLKKSGDVITTSKKYHLYW